MSEAIDFDADDVLGFDDDAGALRVILKDGTERRFTGADIERVKAILAHSTPPTA